MVDGIFSYNIDPLKVLKKKVYDHSAKYMYSQKAGSSLNGAECSAAKMVYCVSSQVVTLFQDKTCILALTTITAS